MTENKEIEKRIDPEFVRVRPLVDILEEKEGWTILADMPGVPAGEVDINLERGDLLVQGRQAVADDVCVAPLLFARSFSVPDTVDAESIDARLEDGVLRITLSKSEKALPKKIEIKTS